MVVKLPAGHLRRLTTPIWASNFALNSIVRQPLLWSSVSSEDLASSYSRRLCYYLAGGSYFM